MNDRPLANEIVPIKAAKDEYQPELYRDVLSKNSHKFQIILCNRNICSFAVKSFMMVSIAVS